MDNPVITEQRDAVPDWAASEVRKATQPQLDYIRDLIAKKDLLSLPQEQQACLPKLLEESEIWTAETTRLSFDKARSMLEVLTGLGWKPKDQQGSPNMGERLAIGVPAGRYAVESDEGLLRFYKVWVSRDGARLNVYVEHGPDESDLKYQKTTIAVLNKIKAAGIRESAIRYGMEIGACSNWRGRC